MNEELYPVISDDDYRGNGFFNAIVKDKKFSVKTEDPDTYVALVYGREELIVETRNNLTYWICAVKRDGLWRTPRPTYQKVYLRYVINADNLETVEQR